MFSDALNSRAALAVEAFGLALILSLAVAWIYTLLHRNAPYSRSFVQALALAGIVSALIVLAIGDSIARGIGLVGAVTVVRFRSNLSDPRDLIFAFAALAAGVASGAQAFGVAIFGTAVLLAATLLVTRPWFATGNHQPVETFDAVLSLRASARGDGLDALADALRTQCTGHSLIRVRQTVDGDQEHAYQLKLKHPDAKAALFQAVQGIRGIGNAQLIAYDGSRQEL